MRSFENTGPKLTPENMQARAPSLPPAGGGTTGQSLLQVLQNNWDWVQDARIVYWDKHKASPYNGQPGTYVQVGPTRYNLGQKGPADYFPIRYSRIDADIQLLQAKREAGAKTKK